MRELTEREYDCITNMRALDAPFYRYEMWKLREDGFTTGEISRKGRPFITPEGAVAVHLYSLKNN